MKPAKLSTQTIHDILNHGTITIEGLLPDSTNNSMLVWVHHAQTRLLAVYKPGDGERPLWDFPHGTLYQREIAAYLINEALGYTLVPPTINRPDAPYGPGALQLFIQHNPAHHLLTLQQDPGYLHHTQILAAFDALINNADRKSGHCLKDPQGHLWAIDHGLCFHHQNKLRTILWDYAGQPLPPHILQNLQNLQTTLTTPDDPMTRQLATLLSAMEQRALLERLHTLITTATYPEPSPHGPHIPWPPI